MSKNDTSERFLITGGTGFIGANLTRMLVAHKKNVSLLVRKKKLLWRLTDIAGKINIVESDILDSSLIKIIDKIKPTHIFHLAAYGVFSHEDDINKMIDVNLLGTVNMVSAIKKHNVKLFINTGSSLEYGNKDKPMKESDILEPITDYGVTKASATLFCVKEAIRSNLPIINFRLSTPFGYYEHRKRLIPSILLSIVQNEDVQLSSPKNVRDFIFIEDVVEAYMQALKVKAIPGEVYNIGSGKQFTVQEVVNTALRISKSDVKPKWGKVAAQKRYIEPVSWVTNINKAKKILRWEPRNNLESGIKKTLAWIKDNKYSDTM